MSFGDLRTRLETLLAIHEDLYEGILVRCVVVQGRKGLLNLWFDAKAVPRGAMPALRGTHEYGAVTLLEAVLTADELVRVVSDAEAGRMKLGTVAIELSQFVGDESVGVQGASPPLVFGRPAHRIDFAFRGKAQPPFERLLRAGRPYYPDIWAAIRDWCTPEDLRPGVDGRVGWLTIRLPECRAQLAETRHENGILSITVTGSHTSLKGAVLKGAYWRADEIGQFEHEVLVDKPSEVPVPHDAHGLELFVLSPNGEILDSHVEATNRQPLRPRVLRWASHHGLEAVRHALQTGEGVHAEFKPFVTPRDKKEREILETIVAFANTAGGLLVIGISDRCTVVGVERELHAVVEKSGRSIDEGVDDYIGELRKRVADALNRSVPLQIVPVEIDGHTVVAVFVPRGAETPYCLREGNEIRVRRGANNVKPDPDLELPLLVRSAG
jgi:hypothetical protein